MLRPIIITEEQIIQAMLAIANETDLFEDENPTEEEALEATATWLRNVVSRLLSDPASYAGRTTLSLPDSQVPHQCQLFRCSAPPAPGDILCAQHRELEESYVRDRQERHEEQLALPAQATKTNPAVMTEGDAE